MIRPTTPSPSLSASEHEWSLPDDVSIPADMLSITASPFSRDGTYTPGVSEGFASLDLSDDLPVQQPGPDDDAPPDTPDGNVPSSGDTAVPPNSTTGLDEDPSPSAGHDDDEKTVVGVEEPTEAVPEDAVLSQILAWARAHPVRASVLGISTAAVASPMMLAAPPLWLAGFTSIGIKGFPAALWMSSIGDVAAGSLFAVLQSAGMGGAMGTAAVSSAVSSAGALGMVGSLVAQAVGRKRGGQESNGSGGGGPDCEKKAGNEKANDATDEAGGKEKPK